jgi:poly-beta-1,6-N-acetyl-D-glucosamine synthase
VIAMVRILGSASAAALLIVWLGYPLAMHLIGRLKGGRRREMPDPLPSVSVVIATRDAPDAVAARVADILATTYDKALVQVIVAVDHAVTGEHAHPPGPAVVVPGDAPGGKAAALNAGVRAATGDILIFTDTFQRFEPEAIGQLVAAFGDARVGAASGALHLPSSGARLIGIYWRLERSLRRDEARISSVIGVTGAIYGMRRTLWRPLPPGLILDDVYTPMRLALEGHRIDFVETARADDRRVTTAAQEYRRKVRTLTGNIQLCAWLPGVLNPVRNPVWLQFMLHKLLRLLTPYWLLLIGLWIAVEIAGQLSPGRLALAAGIAAAVMVWLWRGSDGLARRGRSFVSWMIGLQAAVLRGTYFGLRRRWEVW